MEQIIIMPLCLRFFNCSLAAPLTGCPTPQVARFPLDLWSVGISEIHVKERQSSAVVLATAVDTTTLRHREVTSCIFHRKLLRRWTSWSWCECHGDLFEWVWDNNMRHCSQEGHFFVGPDGRSSDRVSLLKIISGTNIQYSALWLLLKHQAIGIYSAD